MASVAASIARSERDLLRYVRERDNRQVWAKDGCRNMGQGLAPRFGISVSAGMRWTQAAHALEHLPLTSVEFERGQISLDKVLQLTRFASAETEKELLRYARRTSLNALRQKADLATRPPLEEHIENHHARYLELRRFNDAGAIYLEGLLPADEGAIVAKALRRIVDQLPEMPAIQQEVPAQEVPDWARATGIEDFPAETVFVKDGLPQQLADALVVLASQKIASDPIPTAPRSSWPPLSLRCSPMILAVSWRGPGSSIRRSRAESPVTAVCSSSSTGTTERPLGSAVPIATFRPTYVARCWRAMEAAHSRGAERNVSWMATTYGTGNTAARRN